MNAGSTLEENSTLDHHDTSPLWQQDFHSCQPSLEALLLGEKGGNEGLRVSALCGGGLGAQCVLLLNAPHDGIHRLPLPLVLQLRAAGGPQHKSSIVGVKQPDADTWFTMDRGS